MLLEMIFLLDSYSRRFLKFFGWYGLFDTFTKTSSVGLSSLSLPVCQLLFWMAQIIFISWLCLDLDCFFDYTRLCVASAWLLPTINNMLSSLN